jgi:hypothetical protein
VICLSAAAGVIPITSGGAVVNAGAAAAILLALGVGKDIAINFSLASGLLLVVSAVAASLVGVSASLTIAARTAAASCTRAESDVNFRLRGMVGERDTSRRVAFEPTATPTAPGG